VTAASGLKRLAIAVAALVAAAFVTLVALSFLIPTDAVRDAVKKEIEAVTGVTPTLRGTVSVSLFPHARVTFRNVVLGDPADPAPPLRSAELTARLRYFPLLAGRIEIADVTLVEPTVTVALSADGRTNWSSLVRSFAHAVEPSTNRAAAFSEIVVHGGTILVRDPEKQVDERLENFEAQLAWPSISRSFAANGRFVWNNEPVALSLTLGDFVAALTGQHSGLKFRLASKPLNVSFDGAANDQPTLKLDGTLAVDSPSLRDAMHWAGRPKLPFGGFGRFALRAQSSMDANTLSLTNVNVELDGNRAEGVLTLAIEGHHAVQGTLASDTLDFTPYVSGVRVMGANTRSWDRLPIALDGLAAFDLDLRLSAAGIKLASAQLGRTAVALNMRGGHLNVTIGESQSFGGMALGSFGLGSVNGGVAVNSHVQFVDVDLANCLSQLFGLHKLEGRGTLALDVEGTGDSVWALTHTLNGTASVEAHGGALTGINVEQLMRRLEKRPLSGNGDFRSGRTPFERLALSVRIEQGTVSIADLHLDGPSVRLKVAGQASLPSRDLDLRGKATLVSTDTANSFELPFVVEGPWDDPLLLPDASSLIRHSDAAAPLLEAVKKHSAGDAVRSVIDQLFAAPQPGAAPAAEAR
jgi:AsmA protein